MINLFANNNRQSIGFIKQNTRYMSSSPAPWPASSTGWWLQSRWQRRGWSICWIQGVDEIELLQIKNILALNSSIICRIQGPISILICKSIGNKSCQKWQ